MEILDLLGEDLRRLEGDLEAIQGHGGAFQPTSVTAWWGPKQLGKLPLIGLHSSSSQNLSHTGSEENAKSGELHFELSSICLD